uniref:Uncharacterized protein n=1 Tax=Glossina austeni TaxID=7395 RepID=A0A1A9UTT9_GLOAU
MNANMRMPFSILCQPDIMQYNIFIYERIVSHERVSVTHFIERASSAQQPSKFLIVFYGVVMFEYGILSTLVRHERAQTEKVESLELNRVEPAAINSNILGESSLIPRSNKLVVVTSRKATFVSRFASTTTPEIIKKHLQRSISEMGLSRISIFKFKMAQHRQISSLACLPHCNIYESWLKQPRDSMLVLDDFHLPDVTWFSNEDLGHFIPLPVALAYIDFVDRIREFGLMQCNHIYNVKRKVAGATPLGEQNENK